MHIDSSEKISGISILEIRKLLRKGHDSEWSVDFAANLLQISRDSTKNLLEELVKRGFIEPCGVVFGMQHWRNTVKGNALSNASAARRITRKTADRAFSEFMERVERVNTDPYFLYKVRKVVMFGSYLTDAPKLNDVDIAIKLEAKEKDVQRRGELLKERVRKAIEAGKRFRNLSEEIGWPEIEVRSYLKSRSRVISLHATEDEVLEVVDYKVVYSED